MATTPNFNWATPDNTGLVKNGALDIRTLGNAIDASLVDLKGGTTGQVLAKQTNADMDFTWSTPASGGIPATIFDAKGDIIAASAADTAARLAVGADYGFLQALASESTGLQWNSGAWTSYTPTITAGSGTFTSVSGTARYIRIGKLCAVQQQVTVTTNGTAAVEVRLTLPFNASTNICIGSGREVNVTGKMLQGEVNTTYIGWRNYDNSYPVGSNYTFFGTAIYEVA